MLTFNPNLAGWANNCSPIQLGGESEYCSDLKYFYLRLRRYRRDWFVVLGFFLVETHAIWVVTQLPWGALNRLFLPEHPERNIPGPGWLGPAVPPVGCAFFCPEWDSSSHSATNAVLLPVGEKSQPASLKSTCPWQSSSSEALLEYSPPDHRSRGSVHKCQPVICKAAISEAPGLN